jgi:hypothetical protein
VRVLHPEAGPAGTEQADGGEAEEEGGVVTSPIIPVGWKRNMRRRQFCVGCEVGWTGDDSAVCFVCGGAGAVGFDPFRLTHVVTS